MLSPVLRIVHGMRQAPKERWLGISFAQWRREKEAETGRRCDVLSSFMCPNRDFNQQSWGGRGSQIVSNRGTGISLALFLLLVCSREGELLIQLVTSRTESHVH